MAEIKHTRTHVVFKQKDLDTLFDKNPQFEAAYNFVLGGYVATRHEKGKDAMPRYLVCNMDEPYSADVLTAILKGEDDKLVAQESAKITR